MKKNLIFSLLGKRLPMSALLLFAGIFMSVEMMAQRPQATLNGNGVLQLPTNIALADSYEFSIASLNFQNEDQAIEFFRLKSHQEVSFRVNLSQQKAFVYLNKKAHPSWTLTEWNNILHTKTTSAPLLN
jgi:hypothetical protein